MLKRKKKGGWQNAINIKNIKNVESRCVPPLIPPRFSREKNEERNLRHKERVKESTAEQHLQKQDVVPSLSAISLSFSSPIIYQKNSPKTGVKVVVMHTHHHQVGAWSKRINEFTPLFTREINTHITRNLTQHPVLLIE